MSDSLRTFQELLRKLFQFDASDLDFGIYRILNQKRTDIERFIEEDLVETVKNELAKLGTQQQSAAQEKLEKIKKEALDSLGGEAFVDGKIAEQYEATPVAVKYREAKKELAEAAVAEETERRVYDALARFFSRYYDKGDFITKRRFTSRQSKYYVPYDGEEVLLHWANRDQYYIKTSERFTDYHFTAGDFAVHFVLCKAAIPKDNEKASDSRYFILHGDEPLTYDNESKRLTVAFAYRPLTKEEDKQLLDRYNALPGSNRRKTSDDSTINAAVEQIVLELVENPSLKAALAKDVKDSEATILGKNLRRYTARNKYDYFIHKDLGRFLREQLDFYLKNEVLALGDLLDDESDHALMHARLRAKIVRDIGEVVIAFLAQIEDFQKRLFEKMKFVLQTNYCITLDRVPKALYDRILSSAGKAQREAWKDLYHIEDWGDELGYEGTIDRAFLENHPYLMVDTSFFDQDFKDMLLASFDDLDDAINGLLINGDNFQALSLLQETYRDKISCIYIDPPYNTGEDEFVYKDNYKDSCWLSMIADRLIHARSMMSGTSALFSTIDDNEQAVFKLICDEIFGREAFIANVVWQKRTSPDHRSTIGAAHDYIQVFAKDARSFKESANRLPLSENRLSEYQNPDDDPRGEWASVDLTGQIGHATENQFYEIVTPSGARYRPPKGRCWAMAESTFKQLAEDGRIWFGKEGNGRPRLKKYLSEAEGVAAWTWWPNEEVGHNQEGKKELIAIMGPGVAFETPKPTRLIKRILRLTTDASRPEWILDFFAGSGTTAHSAMALNREDGGHRRYVLVEMGEHFEKVLKPRLVKAAFSLNWKDGVPQDQDGETHVIKYHTLESYEDTLNNLRVRQPEGPQRELLYEAFDDYQLHYMLNHETEGSRSLLTQDAFQNPFDYTLYIQHGNNSPQSMVVELEDTFNYMIGLRVRQRRVYEHQDRRYVVVRGSVETESSIEKVVVLWRDTEGLDRTAEAEWAREEILTEPVDRVYVNGPSHIEGAEPLEVIFRTRMEPAA